MGFQKYMEDVRSQLECNADKGVTDQIVFTFSEEKVNRHLDYFMRSFKRSLSAYKALTFFSDYLREEVDDLPTANFKLQTDQ